MDIERETRDVFLSIQQAARWMDPFLKLTTMGGILLLQYFARQATERKLRSGAVKDFSEFIKLTEGKYDIMNIPTMDTEQITKELQDLGVRHMVLPDLNKEDGMLQVAVYQPDKDKFGAWYQRHILNEMKGGEKDLRDLRNLTNGRTSILSLPLEAMKGEWQDDFKAMGINYATLPDLRAGDGQIQVIVANSDLPQVEHWYKLMREDLAKEGTTIEDYSTITMTEYAQTGEMTEQSYIDGADKEYKEANQKYEGKEKGEIEKTLQENRAIKNETAASFESYANDPAYLPISIDHETLVENSSRHLQDFWQKGQFACRVPGTWGGKDKERLLILPLSQVFVRRDGESYLAFIRKDEPPQVIGAETGKRAWGDLPGKDFAKQYFDTVEENALHLDQAQSLSRNKAVNQQGMELERMDIRQQQKGSPIRKSSRQSEKGPKVAREKAGGASDIAVRYKPDPAKRPEHIIPPPVLRR
ncbi:hypothetical protein [Eubacterium sp. An3]|uniref:hypothetical protein n=1 Tax=Eubacterium sp. An3 TaxID=1965628 RepID=UPI000B371DA2|nr:hypothetical protein [Eubacterium sp. An3]OUO25110.1 hypothetical protein B5F87_18310 [Eubacterium sp. An3]